MDSRGASWLGNDWSGLLSFSTRKLRAGGRWANGWGVALFQFTCPSGEFQKVCGGLTAWETGKWSPGLQSRLLNLDQFGSCAYPLSSLVSPSVKCGGGGWLSASLVCTHGKIYRTKSTILPLFKCAVTLSTFSVVNWLYFFKCSKKILPGKTMVEKGHSKCPFPLGLSIGRPRKEGSGCWESNQSGFASASVRVKTPSAWAFSFLTPKKQ